MFIRSRFKIIRQGRDINTKLIRLKRFVAQKDIALAIIATIGIILIGLFFGWYNNKIIPAYPHAHFHYTQEPNNPLSFMSNWDGPDYLSIVHSGYTSLWISNFFPLYPLIVYCVKLLVGSPLISALIVSWLSLTGAVYFYIKILKDVFKVNGTEAMRGVIFFLLFPTGIFLLATYTESLFSFLALGAIYYCLKRSYIRAAILAALSTATHITGVFIAIFIAMILYENKEKIIKVIGIFLASCLGLLTYMVYLWNRFNQPFAFITSQKQNHGWLEHGFSYLISTMDVFNLIFIILLILSAIYWWHKRKSFAIYSLLFLLIPVLGRQFGGFNRYVLVAFPMQIMMYGFLKDRKLGYTIAVALLGISWTYFTLQYAAGYIGG